MRRFPGATAAGSTIVRAVRILLVTPGLGLGGSERLTLAYARGLGARGHDDARSRTARRAARPTTDAAGIERRVLSERQLSARTLPEWLRALHALVARVQARCRAHAVGAHDASPSRWPRRARRCSRRCTASRSRRSSPRRSRCAQPRARGGRLAGVGRRACSATAGAAGRDRSGRRRHRASSSAPRATLPRRRSPIVARSSPASRATTPSRASTCSSTPSRACSRRCPGPGCCWSAAGRSTTR